MCQIYVYINNIYHRHQKWKHECGKKEEETSGNCKLFKKMASHTHTHLHDQEGKEEDLIEDDQKRSLCQYKRF